MPKSARDFCLISTATFPAEKKENSARSATSSSSSSPDLSEIINHILQQRNSVIMGRRDAADPTRLVKEFLARYRRAEIFSSTAIAGLIDCSWRSLP